MDDLPTNWRNLKRSWVRDGLGGQTVPDLPATAVIPAETGFAPLRAPPRRYDLDWLRTLTMIGVFLFHNARFFDPLPWHIKNPRHDSLAALVFVGFLAGWQMPLLMLVSGAGSWFALGGKTGGRYLLDRVKRLLVPFYTVGLLILIPPQYYWELVTNKGFTGPIREFIPRYIETIEWRPGLYFGSYWPGHLWFLRLLFVLSLLCLPLLLYLKSQRGRRIIGALAAFCSRRGGMLLFTLPTLAALLGLQALSPSSQPGESLSYYIGFFLAGYILASESHITAALQRQIWISCGVAVAAFGVMAGAVIGFGYEPWNVRSFTPAFALFSVVQVVNTWGWICLFLGLAGRWLNFNNRFLAYANEAVLPFYVLHQTMILVVGRYVVLWNLPMIVKYVLISIASFIAIIALYELLIRRLNPLRFLFGMRLASRAARG